MKRKLDNFYKDFSDYIENVKKSKIEDDESCLSELKCSITLEVFVVPITIECGHTFEHFAIKKYLLEAFSCPLCKAYCEYDETLKPTLAIINTINKIMPDYISTKKEESKEYNPTFKTKYELTNEEYEEKMLTNNIFKDFVYFILLALKKSKKKEVFIKKNLQNYYKYISQIEDNDKLRKKVFTYLKSNNVYLKYEYSSHKGTVKEIKFGFEC